MSPYLLSILMVVVGMSEECWSFSPHQNQLSDTFEPLLGNLSDIRFLLWTRNNPEDGEYYVMVPEDLNNLQQSPFHPALPTFFMFHGYTGNGEYEWIRRAKTELLRMYDSNVISVDYQTLVPRPFYQEAIENAYRTANYTAGFIDWLGITVGLEASQLHITGHSLGAHTAGMTGKYVTSGTVARVTGLDPAGPMFYDKPSDQRIDKSNAEFVDIMHANAGTLVQGCYGMFEAIGHVDFYPNGGVHQPGCVTTPDLDLDDWLDLVADCSHMRATDLWVESMSAVPPANTFTSWPCSDWDSFESDYCTSCGLGCLNMGFHTQKGLEGSYFLRTNSTSPFALGNLQQPTS